MPDETTNVNELVMAIKALAEGMKHTPASTVSTATPMHGPYQGATQPWQAGLFAQPGIRPDMYSAFQRPASFASALGIEASDIANEKISIMTGVTAGSGDNADDFCDDAPMGGQLKKCTQNYVWGKLRLKTKLNILPEMGERWDYGDMSKEIINMAAAVNPYIPDVAGRMDFGSTMGKQLAYEFWAMGVEIERNFDPVLVTGLTATAPAATRRGWIREFAGLESQIITGRTDMDTGVACPAADSELLSFSAPIDGTTADGRDIVQYLTDLVYALVGRARDVGMDGVSFGFLMPFRMFRILTQVWPCNYYTARCPGATNAPNVTMAPELKKFELDMLNNRYLEVDGVRYPVFFSDGIPEDRADVNDYTSDLYFLPLSYMGRRLLRLQFKKMDAAEIMEFANFAGSDIRISNSGMYMISKRTSDNCTEYFVNAKFRLVQDAPFLAARVQDISYTYLAPYRRYDPADTISYVDGGHTYWAPKASDPQNHL
jgi:hypothetical protein